MRLFLALELPSDLARAVKAEVDCLRSHLPAARWVVEGNLHLTLAFLGEVEDERVPALDAGLAPVFAARPPLTLTLAGSGRFPAAGAPRVLWLGIAPSAELEELQGRAAERAFSVAGREPERRAFHAHLTLGRCRGRWDRRAREVWEAGFDGVVGERFAVTRGVLIASRLTPEGPRYRVVTGYPLEAAGASGPPMAERSA